MSPAPAVIGHAGESPGAGRRSVSPGSRAGPGDREHASRPILLSVVVALVGVALVASMGWRLTGGSLYTIVTPSMCPDLCVGALVLDRPLSGPVHVGEVVTFHPPGTSTVYTHRVVAVLADGSFKTAGDALRSVDPWTVPPRNVLGRVAGHVPGIGWLWRALPWMAAALACVIVARRSVPFRFRAPYDALATTLLVLLPVLVLRPLRRASVIAWHRLGRGGVVMQVANTGLLPAQFRATGAPVVTHVGSGQIVTLVGSARGGPVSLHQVASLWWWQWALVAMIVLSPMLGYLAVDLWHRLGPTRLGSARLRSVPPRVPAPPMARWTPAPMANPAGPGPSHQLAPGRPPFDPLR